MTIRNCFLIILFITVTVSTITAVDNYPVINDGPYIFKENDSTYKILYMCDGQLDSMILTGTDSLAFRGQCHDDDIEYVIKLNDNIGNNEVFQDVSKMFVFSDIHGEYENLVELLKSAAIIDSGNNWIFGDGHLIANGDMLDRGDRVTDILWLLYNLEYQAKKSGGKVHYLLGNHEVMPLQQDFRYVNQFYTDGICLHSGKKYDELFRRNSILGNWLSNKNFIEKINDILFVHGGISPQLIDKKYTIGSINTIMRDNLYLPKDSIKASEELSLLFRGYGPVWYRGFTNDMEDYAMLTENEIDRIMNYFDVEKIIIGHAVQDSIDFSYNGKVAIVNIDYERPEEYQGLLIEGDRYTVVDINGQKRVIR